MREIVKELAMALLLFGGLIARAGDLPAPWKTAVIFKANVKTVRGRTPQRQSQKTKATLSENPTTFSPEIAEGLRSKLDAG